MIAANPVRYAWPFVALVGVLSVAPAAAEEKTLTLDSRDIRSLKISAGGGFLHIEGVDGLDKIQVIADVNADRDGYELSLDRAGDAAVLVSRMKAWSFLWFGAQRIDLTVRAPARLKLDVEDGSGEIVLGGMKAAAVIRDGSGSTVVKDHGGSLELHDGSGGIDIQSVTGDVKIVDGSGGLSVKHVVGDVNISDGSGSIEVGDVDGHVTIRDGSGGIDVDDVKRGLTIVSSGSGGLSTSRVQGGIDIDK